MGRERTERPYAAGLEEKTEKGRPEQRAGTAEVKVRIRQLIDDYNSQVPIHRNRVPCLDKMRRVGHARYAGKAVFPGDDCTVNQHPSPPLHDPRGERDHEGHLGFYGIADEDFPCLEIEKVRTVKNKPDSFLDVKLHNILKLAHDVVGIDVDPEQGTGRRCGELPEIGMF